MLVTRFGRPLRIASRPGLHWKLPWPIDQASLLDMRRRVYETGHTEMLTRDKKNIIARTFVVWRIGDPLTFIQAIGLDGGAETKLDGLLTNAAIGTLGGHDLSALVSTIEYRTRPGRRAPGQSGGRGVEFPHASIAVQRRAGRIFLPAPPGDAREKPRDAALHDYGRPLPAGRR